MIIILQKCEKPAKVQVRPYNLKILLVKGIFQVGPTILFLLDSLNDSFAMKYMYIIPEI